MIDVVYLLHSDYYLKSNYDDFLKKIKKIQEISKFDIKIIILLKGNFQKKIKYFEDVEYLKVEKIGRDIYTYLKYCLISNSEYIFFFNSSSQIKSFLFLEAAINELLNKNCGAISATGSFGSLFDLTYLNQSFKYSLINQFEYTYKFPIISILHFYMHLKNYKGVPHLRTNAFGLRRSYLINIISKTGLKKNKINSHIFESGSIGLSGLLNKENLELLIIDKDGNAYNKDKWMMSETYAYKKQKNLAIIDNRTMEYESSNFIKKKKIMISTWANCNEYKNLTNLNLDELIDNVGY